MSVILAAFLAKAAPYIGMAVSVLVAIFSVKRSAKHAATAEANSQVALEAAKVSVTAQVDARKQVERVSKETKNVQDQVNSLSDDAAISELRKDWNRDAASN